MGQEKSLQLSKRADETLWGRAITNIGRVFYSSSFNIYTLLIARRRSVVIRAFNNYMRINEFKEEKKRDEVSAKYKKSYADYINMLDKYITENIYTKMQKRAATVDEERIMSQYYAVNKYKETDEVEHRIRLETLCLNMDWENVQSSKSDNYVEKFKAFFVYNLEELYKARMRHNAILLANAKKGDRDQYEAIYNIIETYIKEALPILPEREKFNGIIKDYKKYVSAIDSYEQKDFLELRKRLTLLGFAKELFEYSFPAIAQEQCYLEIIEIARVILSNYYTDADKYAAYEVLLDAIEEYIENVLEYKAYWISEVEKKEFKALEEKWQVLKKLARIDYDCYLRKREVLFIKYDLNTMKRAGINIPELKEYYRERLIIRKALKMIRHNSCSTKGIYFPIGKGITSHARAYLKVMVHESESFIKESCEVASAKNASDLLQEMIRESELSLNCAIYAEEALYNMLEECNEKLSNLEALKSSLNDMVDESIEETSVTKKACKALFEMRREAYSRIGQMIYIKSLLSDMIAESKEDTSVTKKAQSYLADMLKESSAISYYICEAKEALKNLLNDCEYNVSMDYCKYAIKDMIAECESDLDTTLEAKKSLCMMVYESEQEARFFKVYSALWQMLLECKEDLSITKEAKKALDCMLTECKNATNITERIRESLHDIVLECEEDTSIAKDARALLSNMIDESIIDTDIAKDARACLRGMILECKQVVKVDYIECIINDAQNLVNEQYKEYCIKLQETAKEAVTEPEPSFNLMDLIVSGTKNLKKKRKAKI